MIDPSPQQLYERLLEVTQAGTDEDLARKLDMPLRSLQRLKEGRGASYERTVQLLSVAGWLAIEQPPLTPEEESEVARQLALAEAALARLREQLA